VTSTSARWRHSAWTSAGKIVLRCRHGKPSAPPAATADVGHIRARRLDFRRLRRHPYLPPKHPTQPGDAHPGDLDDPAMQIAASQCRAEQMIVVLVRIGVMVARNEPHLGVFENGSQFDLQLPLRLEIPEQHQRCRPLRWRRLQHRLGQVIEAPMHVPAQPDRRQISCCGRRR